MKAILVIEIRTPATSANLGSGFDTLGLALTLYNIFIIKDVDIKQTRLEIYGEGEIELPRDESNLFIKSMQHIFKLYGKKMPKVHAVIHNAIPLNRGLGSSATAVVAGVCAANELLGRPFSKDELINEAVNIEGHPDNVVPCLTGGLAVSCITEEGVKYVNINFPENISIVVAVPDIKISTAEARKALPEEVSLKDAIYNLSRVSLLTASLATGKLENLPWAMEDKLHQPFRLKLFKGGNEIIKEIRKLDNCLGVAISGSGPSMLAFTKGNPHLVAKKMCVLFNEHGIKSRFFVLEPDNDGVIIKRDA